MCCPEKLWVPCPWKHWRPGWMGLRATQFSGRCPFPWWGCGIRLSLMSLLTNHSMIPCRYLQIIIQIINFLFLIDKLTKDENKQLNMNSNFFTLRWSRCEFRCNLLALKMGYLSYQVQHLVNNSDSYQCKRNYLCLAYKTKQ